MPPKCNVIRNGQIINILAEELVRGDILRLQNGDRVGADARLIQCNSLTVDESSLTGESEPREKTSNALNNMNDDCPLSDRTNIVFMGTLICTGNAQAVVIETGTGT